MKSLAINPNGNAITSFAKVLNLPGVGEYIYIYIYISWQQHPTRHQLYGHLPPITKTIQARRTRHAGHCWRSKDELMYTYGPPHMAKQKQDDQLEHIYSSYVKIRDVALKTCQRRWMIGRSGERGSGISMLAAWHDDDDDDYIYILYIYMYYIYVLYIYIYILSAKLLPLYGRST